MLAGLGWSGLAQALALAGGLAAVAALLLNRRDAAAAQASKVYIFIEKHNPDARQGPPELIAKIHNDSDQPVFDLSISVWRWGKRRPLWRLAESTEM